jgi:hypothetical protein
MDMIGNKILQIRPMTKAELQAEGWNHSNEVPSVIVLENGLKLYPSRDTEGNGGGCLFGVYKNKHFCLL